jgi:uncharacterized protein YndB with AHSA1/START domain
MTTTQTATATVSRTIQAPPGEVYRAFLDPAVLRRWFFPQGHELIDVTVDERVGGRHRTEVVSPTWGHHAFDASSWSWSPASAS